jgi:hypothetical protein
MAISGKTRIYGRFTRGVDTAFPGSWSGGKTGPAKAPEQECFLGKLHGTGKITKTHPEDHLREISVVKFHAQTPAIPIFLLQPQQRASNRFPVAQPGKKEIRRW